MVSRGMGPGEAGNSVRELVSVFVSFFLVCDIIALSWMVVVQEGSSSKTT